MLVALALKTPFRDAGLCGTEHLSEQIGSAPGSSQALLALKRGLEGSLSTYSVRRSCPGPILLLRPELSSLGESCLLRKIRFDLRCLGWGNEFFFFYTELLKN